MSVILNELIITYISVIKIQVDQWFLHNSLSRRESTQKTIERIHSFLIKNKKFYRDEINKLLDNWEIVNDNECSKQLISFLS